MMHYLSKEDILLKIHYQGLEDKLVNGKKEASAW
jgi:hypothetical protein